MDVADFVSEEDICPIEAGSADEALKILEDRNDIDVVFTDVNMPGSMSGLELAGIINNRWPKIGIIVTSGMVRPTRAALGRAGFIEKPYDISRVSAFFKLFATA